MTTATRYHIEEEPDGRWIIVNFRDAGLAWAHDHWTDREQTARVMRFADESGCTRGKSLPANATANRRGQWCLGRASIHPTKLTSLPKTSLEAPSYQPGFASAKNIQELVMFKRPAQKFSPYSPNGECGKDCPEHSPIKTQH
jgi:hypothetical protein